MVTPSTAPSRRCRSAAPCPPCCRRSSRRRRAVRRRRGAGRACRAARRGRRRRRATTNIDHHRREDRPALAAVADHAPEGGGERGRDQQDQQQLEEVRERRRVLERHRRVDVEEAAAVGAELLDGLLRGDRAERERLGAAGERVGGLRAARVWITPWETRTARRRTRSAAARRASCGPGRPRSCRAPCPLRAAKPRISAASDGDADRRRDEVLHRQPGHLAEVDHRRLAAVELPVGVGDERRGGVEADVPGAGVEASRVERMELWVRRIR